MKGNVELDDPEQKKRDRPADAYRDFSPVPPVRAENVRMTFNDAGLVFKTEGVHVAEPSSPRRRWRTRSVTKSINMTVTTISKRMALTSV